MSKEKISILKIGGNIIENKEKITAFLSLFSKIKGPKILVHGGGKSATQFSEKLGLETKMMNGRRITDKDSLDVITMVYAGLINKNIVANLQRLNCDAIGMSGADAGSILSVKRPVKDIDFGWVGDVISINAKNINRLLNSEITPVFCAITHDGKGQLLNTNADTIAAELAIGLSEIYESHLYYCFELNGVLLDISDESSVIERITTDDYEQLLDQNLISNGMLPKLKNCFDAINKGVSKVYIGNQNLFNQTDKKYTTIQL